MLLNLIAAMPTLSVVSLRVFFQVGVEGLVATDIEIVNKTNHSLLQVIIV